MKLGEIAARVGCRIDAGSKRTRPTTVDAPTRPTTADARPAPSAGPPWRRTTSTSVAWPASSRPGRRPDLHRQPEVPGAARDDAGLGRHRRRRRAGRGVPSSRRCCARDDPYLAFARAVGLLAAHAPPAPGIDPLSAIARRRDARRRRVDRRVRDHRRRRHRSARARSSIRTSSSAPARRSATTASCMRTCRFASASRSATAWSLQDGAVIGSDGFGFVKQADGTHLKIPQHADVVIEDDVEIGANTTIDRPAVGETRIGAGTKIDNLVQIAHGVTVGRRVLFAAQVGIAGSTVVEDDVVLAGQVGRGRAHLRIGKGVVATRADRRPEFGGRRAVRLRLSGHPQPRLAEVVRRLPSAARAEEARCGARAAHSRNSRRSSRMLAAVGSLITRAAAAGRRAPRSPAPATALAQQPLAVAPERPSSSPATTSTCRRGHRAKATIRASRGTRTGGGDFDSSTTSRAGRRFLADYQALLGDEFRPFDPNQSNYTLEASSSWRAQARPSLPVAFNHVSRHLAIGPSVATVAGNSLGRACCRQVRPSGGDARSARRRRHGHRSARIVDYTG